VISRISPPPASWIFAEAVLAANVTVAVGWNGLIAPTDKTSTSQVNPHVQQ
jgi:hypothetical protein